MSRDSKKRIKWDKLDNTANLFPVIVSENVSNVYRISATLVEEIDRDVLQQALEEVLPFFDVFNSRMKKGLFWYYFETNLNDPPRVEEENKYPCEYINPFDNRDYLFRVSFYKRRINLEVFHVLTDGNGALMFLKELVYQYLRLRHTELADKKQGILNIGTSLDKEDSYVKNYKKAAKKEYNTKKAFIIRGQRFQTPQFGIMHGYVNLQDIKRVSKKYGVTINQYLIGLFAWAVYEEYMSHSDSDVPFSACVPVNLRPYFNSDTNKNFFAIVSAVFKPTKDSYTFEEVLGEIKISLDSQINKEHLEKLFSYNVSNEKNKAIRAVPLFIKNIAMRSVYKSSARANTTTVTNLGVINVDEKYQKYIERFHVILSMSKGQNIKGGVCSYKDTLVFTFSAAIKETFVQKCFFRKMVEDGINVSIETNGAYYE